MATGKEPCARRHDCDHPVQHACHYGDACPPCPVLVSKVCAGGHGLVNNVRCGVKEVTCGKVCGQALSCGEHTCPTNCHSASKPCSETYDKAPIHIVKAAAPVKKMETKKVEAAKLQPKVDVDSWEDLDGDEDEGGGDEDAGAKAPPSAEEGEPAEETEAAAPAAVPVVSCGLKCGRLRDCGHPCEVRCHPGQVCPTTICRTLVAAKCKCGRREAKVECRYGDTSLAATHAGFYAKKQLKFMSATAALTEVARGGSSESAAAATAEGEAQSQWRHRTIACDKACIEFQKQQAQEQRNKMLAMAMNIEQPNTTAYGGIVVFFGGWEGGVFLFYFLVGPSRTCLLAPYTTPPPAPPACCGE